MYCVWAGGLGWYLGWKEGLGPDAAPDLCVGGPDDGCDGGPRLGWPRDGLGMWSSSSSMSETSIPPTLTFSMSSSASLSETRKQLQSNFDGSNTFGTMENCSSHG